MALFLLCPNLGWIQGQFNFTELSLRYLLFIIPTSVCTSLFVEGCNGENLLKTTKKSLSLVFMLLTPTAIFIIICGDSILSLINPSYIAGAEILRLFVLSCFPMSIVFIFFSIMRIVHNTRPLFVVSLFLFVFLMSSMTFFMSIYGLIGIGYGWTLSYLIAAGICAYLLIKTFKNWDVDNIREPQADICQSDSSEI